MPQPERFKELVIQNGLEYKICIATYKMFYVENTEDVQFAKKKRNTPYKASPSPRFAEWLKTRREAVDAAFPVQLKAEVKTE